MLKIDLIGALIIVMGLAVFETVGSVDNAIMNSSVLVTMRPKVRRWFITYGLVFAVFVVRGLLPWLLLWSAAPSSGFLGVFVAGLSNDPMLLQAIRAEGSILLSAGGIFLVALFLHWFLIEDKEYIRIFKISTIVGESILYAVVVSLLLLVTLLSIGTNIMIAIGALAGVILFFIIFKVRDLAEKEEKLLAREGRLTDWSKIMYLELIDVAFSVDSVLGAFAFTFSIPLILLGVGLGALIVRNLTLMNIKRLAKYRYLKNGAMYSVVVLGVIMIADSFGINVPGLLSPIATLLIVAYFLYKSIAEKSG